jgi:ATP-dependent RNA helicase RhlE
MLDMGFNPDIRKIVALLPARRQNLLFSATFSDEIRRLSQEFLHDPETVEVAARNTAAEGVEQVLYPVDRDRKEDLLIHLIRRDHMEQVLVFTRTKLAASRLASYLDRRGVNAVAIHSDRSQPERTRALEDFKRGEVTCLVATDVASRGLDIEELPYVVNFELPFEAQDYIHRIGRTGRAGSTGIAISLVCTDEVELLKAVQRLLKKAIPYRVVEGFEPDRSIPARPIRGFGRDGGSSSDGRGHHAHHKPIRTRTTGRRAS